MSTDTDYNYNPNKIVTITKFSKSWSDGFFIPSNLQLYAENDINFSINQTYEDPFEEIMNAAKGTLIGSIAQGFAGLAEFSSLMTNTRIMTRFSNAKAWKSSSQISFDLQFSFFMGMTGEYNGLKEVYLPMMALAHVFLPTMKGPMQILGPGPSYASILALQGDQIFKNVTSEVDGFFQTIGKLATAVADKVKADISKNKTLITTAGDAAQALLNGIVDNTKTTIETPSSDMYMGKNNNVDNGGDISIRIGKIYSFDNVLPIDFSYSFSKETDDGGFPIYGTCSIHCETFKIGVANDLPYRDKSGKAK
jgi:hypothetical protein